MKRLIILFVGSALLAACATAKPKYEGVFIPQEYVHQLKPGAKGQAQLRWLRPGVDFAKYDKFMVDYVVFALAPNSQYKGINADEMKQLADEASLALVNSIKEKYEVVSEPGPDVARVRFAIVDLEQSRPAVSVITTVIPVGLGISLVKKGATGEWTGGGLTKAEALVLDSQTNEVIAAGYDDYASGFTERYTKWASFDDAFKHWGENITNALTELRKGNP